MQATLINAPLLQRVAQKDEPEIRFTLPFTLEFDNVATGPLVGYFLRNVQGVSYLLDPASIGGSVSTKFVPRSLDFNAMFGASGAPVGDHPDQFLSGCFYISIPDTQQFFAVGPQGISQIDPTTNEPVYVNNNYVRGNIQLICTSNSKLLIQKVRNADDAMTGQFIGNLNNFEMNTFMYGGNLEISD